MCSENFKVEKVFCVSAKTGQNVENMFEYIVKGLFASKYKLDDWNSSIISSDRFSELTGKSKNADEVSKQTCC